MPNTRQTTTRMSSTGPSRGTMNSLCGLPEASHASQALLHRRDLHVGDDERDERDRRAPPGRRASSPLVPPVIVARRRVREVADLDDRVLEHRVDFDRARAVLHLDRRRVEARRRLERIGCAASGRPAAPAAAARTATGSARRSRPAARWAAETRLPCAGVNAAAAAARTAAAAARTLLRSATAARRCELLLRRRRERRRHRLLNGAAEAGRRLLHRRRRRGRLRRRRLHAHHRLARGGRRLRLALRRHLHLRRAVVGLRRHRLTDGDDELGVAEHDLIARLQLGLVDLLPVDQRALGRAEIDDVDLARTGDLDHRVHAADRLVVDAQVARRQLADLDDVLGQRLGPDELIPLRIRSRTSGEHSHRSASLLLTNARSGQLSATSRPQRIPR